MNAGPIRKANLLNKLCFVRYGLSLEQQGKIFRQELFERLDGLDPPPISTQTIRYWFEKNSAPTRLPAFQFLYDYLGEAIDYAALPLERKKVFKQVSTFLREAIATRPAEKVSEKIYASSKGRIVIDMGGPERDFVHAHIAQLQGVYRTYRVRLSEAETKPFAQEVLRLYRRKTEVRFEHHYLQEGSQLSRFEGVATGIGDILWLIGASNSSPERLRIINFRFVPTSSDRYTQLRWGIMLSDVSIPSLRDPAACRIVLTKVEDPGPTLAGFVRDNVRLVSAEDIKDPNKALITRLIDNTLTAASSHRSAEPALDRSGRLVQDTILKVSQATLDAAIEKLLSVPNE
jgi:hypothetical protein